MKSVWKAAVVGLLAIDLVGCGAEPETQAPAAEPVGSTDLMSFEEFMSKVYQEPWEGGLYIYNGDTPVRSIDELKKAHAEMNAVQQGLAVNRVSYGDDVWYGNQQLNLRYCIGNGFGSYKPRIINAMATAAAAWEAYAGVDFIYDSSQDANCTNANPNVVFDVNLVNVNGAYLARAFFPSFPRSSRNVYVDLTAFSSNFSLDGVMIHELGHALGFRHEHTRPEAGRCFEDNSWRGVTPYDRASIMHYPQCGGTNTNLANSVSTYDVEGAAYFYGSKTFGRATFPGGCGVIPSGYGLNAGQGLYSCDGRFLFVLQGDGNLVLYQGGTPIWASTTSGQAAYTSYMQGDGNFVVYTGLPRAIFATGTSGHNGATLYVQNDGNVVIYNAAGVPVWATNTGGR